MNSPDNIENMGRDQSIFESNESIENNRQVKADRLKQIKEEFGVLQTRLLSSIGTDQDLEKSQELYEEIIKLQKETGL